MLGCSTWEMPSPPSNTAGPSTSPALGAELQLHATDRAEGDKNCTNLRRVGCELAPGGRCRRGGRWSVLLPG